MMVTSEDVGTLQVVLPLNLLHTRYNPVTPYPALQQNMGQATNIWLASMVFPIQIKSMLGKKSKSNKISS